MDCIAIQGKARVFTPHTAGRYQKKRFRKTQCPIVERLVNSMMMHGRYVEHTIIWWLKVNKPYGDESNLSPLSDYIVNIIIISLRNNGKKLKAIRIVNHAFEIIHVMTDKNPVQVFVDAVKNGGPREDSTRIGSAGVVRRQAVDVSPLRRVNQAIYLICTGAR